MRAIMRGIALMLLAACVCYSAYAQDQQPPPPHGGQIRTAGPYLLELIAARDQIAIYVTDHAWRPIDTAGGKGKAVVHTDGRAVTIDIHPAAPNSLTGRGRYRLRRSSVIYVTVDLKRAPAHRIVFRPLSETPTAKR